MADLDSREILATAFAQGHTHDFQLFQHSCCFPVRSTRVLADAGYQGLAEIHPNS